MDDTAGAARELLGLARDAYSTRAWDRLFALLLEAARLEPDNASTHFKLGYELLRRGLVPAALDAMRTALALEPSNVDFCTEFGAVLLSLRRFADAENWFDGNQLHCARHPAFWVARGKNLLALDRYADAEGAFRTALEFDPGQVDATGMLVVALMAQGRAAEARGMAKEVAHVMHADPARDWRDVIAFCKGLRRPGG